MLSRWNKLLPRLKHSVGVLEKSLSYQRNSTQEFCVDRRSTSECSRYQYLSSEHVWHVPTLDQSCGTYSWEKFKNNTTLYRSNRIWKHSRWRRENNSLRGQDKYSLMSARGVLWVIDENSWIAWWLLSARLIVLNGLVYWFYWFLYVLTLFLSTMWHLVKWYWCTSEYMELITEAVIKPFDIIMIIIIRIWGKIEFCGGHRPLTPFTSSTWSCLSFQPLVW